MCSARSGSTKALGTTNLLLRAAGEALQRVGIGSIPPQTPGTATPPAAANYFGRPQAQDSFNSSNSPPASPTVSGLSRRHSPSSSPSPFSSFSGLAFTSLTPSFNATVDLLKSEHVTAAKQSVNDPGLLKELITEIEQDCEGLRNFLFAAQVCGLNLEGNGA